MPFGRPCPPPSPLCRDSREAGRSSTADMAAALSTAGVTEQPAAALTAVSQLGGLTRQPGS